MTNVESSKGKTYSDELEVFLRILTVNMIGGSIWALIQPLKEYNSSEPVLVAISGAVVGAILSMSGFLVPRLLSKFERRNIIYRMICDLTYSLISIYLTSFMIFILTASAIVLAGGYLTVKSSGRVIASLSMVDLINSYSLDYLLQLSLISISGSLITTVLRLLKARICKHINLAKLQK